MRRSRSWKRGSESYPEQYSNRIGCLRSECHQDWKCAEGSVVTRPIFCTNSSESLHHSLGPWNGF